MQVSEDSPHSEGPEISFIPSHRQVCPLSRRGSRPGDADADTAASPEIYERGAHEPGKGIGTCLTPVCIRIGGVSSLNHPDECYLVTLPPSQQFHDGSHIGLLPCHARSTARIVPVTFPAHSCMPCRNKVKEILPGQVPHRIHPQSDKME